jgi:hypothetical protein
VADRQESHGPPTTTLYVDPLILFNMLMPSSTSITDGPPDIMTVEAILNTAIGAATRTKATPRETYDTTYTEGESGIDPTRSLLNQTSGEQLDNISVHQCRPGDNYQ